MAAAGKVTVRMAAAIREEAAAGATYASLEAKYGVHRTTISRVARGVTAGDAPGTLAKPRNVWKLYCVNGHLLAENRNSRNANCRTCHRDRGRAARALARARAAEMTGL
jgi:hypothetical protein